MKKIRLIKKKCWAKDQVMKKAKNFGSVNVNTVIYLISGYTKI